MMFQLSLNKVAHHWRLSQLFNGIQFSSFYSFMINFIIVESIHMRKTWAQLVGPRQGVPVYVPNFCIMLLPGISDAIAFVSSCRAVLCSKPTAYPGTLRLKSSIERDAQVETQWVEALPQWRTRRNVLPQPLTDLLVVRSLLSRQR